MTDDDPKLTILPDELPPDVPAAVLPSAGASRRVDGLAVAALVLGVASVAFAGVAIGPIAMICGIVALVRVMSNEGRGQGFAAAGIALGLLGTVLWAGLIWYWSTRDRHAPDLTTDTSPPLTTGTLDRTAVDNAPPVIRRALLSSVSVIVERPIGGGQWAPSSTGSGTVIAKDSGVFYILTCKHVLPRAADKESRVRVQWVGGEGTDIQIEWRAGPAFDIALLSTRAASSSGDPQVSPVGDSHGARVSDPVFAIGDPVNYRTSYVNGVLSAVRTLAEGGQSVRVFQTQIPLNPGNSGGGLYNPAGELIAINSWKIRDTVVEGIGFSIAIENLWVALKEAPPRLAETLTRLIPAASSSHAPAGVEDRPGPESPDPDATSAARPAPGGNGATGTEGPAGHEGASWR